MSSTSPPIPALQHPSSSISPQPWHHPQRGSKWRCPFFFREHLSRKILGKRTISSSSASPTTPPATRATPMRATPSLRPRSSENPLVDHVVIRPNLLVDKPVSEYQTFDELQTGVFSPQDCSRANVAQFMCDLILTPGGSRCVVQLRGAGSAGWLVGWLAGWLVGWLAGWLVGWLAGWLVGWLAGWLVGWLVGWFGSWEDEEENLSGTCPKQGCIGLCLCSSYSAMVDGGEPRSVARDSWP